MIIGIIPARLESTRFPHKILHKINNKPMVMYVYERAIQSKKIDKIIVAVDSPITVKELKKYNVETVLTSLKHQSGTDRIAEVVKNIDAEIIINIQADEPMLEPNLLDKLIMCFDDTSVQLATLASRKIDVTDLNNPNVVKVEIDKNSDATGFYRTVEDNSQKYFRHIGLYGYRKNVLERVTKLKPTKNELKHQLEQLRALENGIPIKVVLCEFPFHGIDTPDDLIQLNL